MNKDYWLPKNLSQYNLKLDNFWDGMHDSRKYNADGTMREFYNVFILRVSLKHFGAYNKIVHAFLRHLNVNVSKWFWTNAMY